VVVYCDLLIRVKESLRWKDTRYIIGSISRNVLKLRVVNTLTQQSDVFRFVVRRQLKKFKLGAIQCFLA